MATLTTAEGIGVSIYPNPTNRFVNLEVEDGWQHENLSVEITDLQGKQISFVSLNESSKQIDMDGRPAGMYLAILRKDGQHIVTHKFVLSRDQ